MDRKNIDVDGYERVIHITDDASGLDAIISLHSTHLGPAIGGIRYYEYKSFDDQLNDALRLSKGMTFKNAAGGLNNGGAKTTINASKIKNREAAFQTLGKAVNLLDGAYICAGDVGTTVADLYKVNDGTSYVAGITLDSSYPTALGVHTSIKTLLAQVNNTIHSSTFMIQGLGKVGSQLVTMLQQDGGIVRGVDPFTRIDSIKMVTDKELFTTDSTMYVPCALGATLNFKSLNTMKPKLVCGSANNQFETENDVGVAHNLGYKYVPDFIANCGGVVAVALDFQKKDYHKALTTDLESKIKDILDEAQYEDVPAQIMAEHYANRRLMR
jgi:leucine dehydrogenase